MTITFADDRISSDEVVYFAINADLISIKLNVGGRKVENEINAKKYSFNR